MATCRKCEREFGAAAISDPMMGPLTLHVRREEFQGYCDSCCLTLAIEAELRAIGADPGYVVLDYDEESGVEIECVEEHNEENCRPLEWPRAPMLLRCLITLVDALDSYARHEAWEKVSLGMFASAKPYHRAPITLSGGEVFSDPSPGWLTAERALNEIFEAVIQTPEQFEAIAEKYEADPEK